MDKVFTRHGIDFISWKDAAGNTWEAEEHAVRFFGKETIEQMPEEIYPWCVHFRDDELSELPTPTDEDYEYADSFFNL